MSLVVGLDAELDAVGADQRLGDLPLIEELVEAAVGLR